MASGKRASMREGPLAALFRRTDDAAHEAEAAARAAEQTARPAQDPRSGPLSEPRRSEAAPVYDGGATTAADGAGAPASAAAQRAYPHPSLAEGTPPAPEPERAQPPSPRERLRHAFTTDIPDDVLQRGPGESYAQRPRPRAPHRPCDGTRRPAGPPACSRAYRLPWARTSFARSR